MSAKSDFLENAFLDHVFRGLAYAAPTQLNIGLFTGAPSDAGGGTEVTGGAYARVNHAPGATNWRNTQNSGVGASTGASGQIANLTTVTFATPTANWGTVTHFGLFDQTGNLLYQAVLSAAKTINNGDAAPTFPAGSIVVTEA